MASSNFIDDDDDFDNPIPFFNGQKYYYWKDRMQSFLMGNHFDEWEAIEDGPFVPTYIVDGLTKEKPRCEWTNDDKKMVRVDWKAKSLLFGALSDDQLRHVFECETAQQVWNTLRDIHEGTGKVKMQRINSLTIEYERFCMKPGENIDDMQMRFYDLVNHLASLEKRIPNVDLVYKVLRSLSRKWQHKVRTIMTSRDLTTMPLRHLFIELEEYEVELNRLDKNEERHMKKKKKKKKKDSGSAVASPRKDDEEVDSDDEEMNLVIKDLSKLLKKNKKYFKQGEKEHKKRGSSSTRAMP